MYIYDRESSHAPSIDKAIEYFVPSRLSGGIAAVSRQIGKPSVSPRETPAWIQNGVRSGRWTPQTASALWALRKISHG